MPRCSLTPRPDGLALQSPYDPAFVAAFKAAVPHSARSWDGQRKVWIVAANQANNVADLCATFFGERPVVPQVQTGVVRPELRVLTLEYLGMCKTRDDGSVTAMGYADGAWSVIAPEPVLRAWFEGTSAADTTATGPASPATYYGLLGVPQRADEAALKQGYKRMARQWHPDANKEVGAHEMFLRIREAYNILSDPLLRKKYNAGLLFEQRNKDTQVSRVAVYQEQYRAPLTCGVLVAHALPRLGRWELTSILSWADITDLAGRVMVSSWDRDHERIKTEWVLP